MIYICLFFLLFSCSAHYYRDAAMQLREGRFEEAEKNLAKADLYYTQTNEASLFLLSRAMVYFQSGQHGKSCQDFERAFDAIDYYQQKSAVEITGQTLLQDDIAAYLPPTFEQSLARFYQALSFLHQGEEDNAAATVYYLENHLSPSDQNPLTSYLLATLFHRRGDVSNAKVLCRRLKLDLPQGNVLFIHHRGIAPQKKSRMVQASVVSAALLEEILQVHDIRPALSTLTGVPIPVLHNTARPTWTLKINQELCQPTLIYDVARAAEDHLEKEMPWTAARAAARILLRRGLVASTKKEYQPLVDAAMLISNAVTQADIRSWAMLPSSIDLYHLDLKPGEHQIQVGRQSRTITIKLKELTVIEIFQPTAENIMITQETT
jgi:hypothetical protein